MNTTALTAALSSLVAGDIVTITFDGGARTVEVQSVEAGYVFTTSGKVAPGRVGGGAIRIREDGVTFQPTLMQAPKAITKVERAVLRFGRAA